MFWATWKEKHYKAAATIYYISELQQEKVGGNYFMGQRT